MTLPAGSEISGTTKWVDGWLNGVGDQPVLISGPLVSEKPVWFFQGRAGKGAGVAVEFLDEGGKTLMSTTVKASERMVNQYAGYKITGQVVYPDNDLLVSSRGVGRPGQSRYCVRPNPFLYSSKEQLARKADWEKLPGAAETPFSLELRPTSQGRIEIWVNGQFLNVVPPSETRALPVRFQLKLGDGAAMQSLEFKAPPSSKELVLAIAEHARVTGETTARIEGSYLPDPVTEVVPVEGMPNARLKFDAPKKLPERFREFANQTAGGIAVGGLGKIEGLASIDLTSLYWSRKATDHLPNQCMFVVPLATYSHAEVLCAVDADPNHANTFTLRVTRYASRGDAMADTLVTVPRTIAEANENARPVGSVTYGPAEAPRTAPLWLIRVPLRNGVIQELLTTDTRKSREMGTSEYLDLEIMDPLENLAGEEVFPPTLELSQRTWTPSFKANLAYDSYLAGTPLSPTSGVTIFDLTLKKSPVTMEVKTNIGIQVFYASDQPEFLAQLTALETGDFSVAWDFADVDGKIVATGTQSLALSAGETKAISVPVTTKVGWFAARFRLKDKAGGELMDTRTSFVMLPPDTRTAGYESPFYGWWFGPGHGADIKLEEAGPLFQRLGIRRVDLPPEMPESLTEKYGFTESHIPWTPPGSGRGEMNAVRDKTKTVEEAVAAHEAFIREQLKLWPHIDRMLVFHESGDRGAPFPSELWGEPAKAVAAPLDENSPEALAQREGGDLRAVAAEKDRKNYEKNWPSRMVYLEAMAKMVREKFPQLKMQYGNDGNSLGIMGELFRQKFPKKWMDTISIEDLGQTFLPENVAVGGLHSAWFLRELARKTGYGDVPITASTEWIGRMTLRLGNRAQAEWKARDGLLALAYGFDTISLAGLNDTATGYYFTSWGNGGLCERYPMLAPKPSFAAIATLTQVMDRAKFQQFVPTGSMVLYVAEFQRGQEWVYALWTPRGDREITLNFPADATRKHVDLYGRASELTGQSLQLIANTAPQYLVSKDRLTSALAGKSSFPAEIETEKPTQIIPLESLDAINIVANPKLDAGSKNRPENLPQWREGNFEIREVVDPEMGKCLEVELKPEGKLWEMTHEYVTLQLTKPVPTEAKSAGVWVKGNGSWGRVNIDTKQGWGPWASNNNRFFSWPAVGKMNFEGWNFIRYPFYDWTRKNDNIVQGLIITFPRSAVVGTEMQPVENQKIRLKSISLF